MILELTFHGFILDSRVCSALQHRFRHGLNAKAKLPTSDSAYTEKKGAVLKAMRIRLRLSI